MADASDWDESLESEVLGEVRKISMNIAKL